MNYRILIFYILLFFNGLVVLSQQTLSLEQCYELAKKNHPLSKKAKILERQNTLELQSLDAQKLPRFDADAQATYQSDVTKLPIALPNMSIESPNQFQYKTTLTVSQLIYNAGLIDTQKELKKNLLTIQEKEIEVQIHLIKFQINQLYYGILMTDQKNLFLNKNIAQLRDKKTEIEKLILTGSTYESATEPIQVKILELEQSLVELKAHKEQLLNQLSLVIGQKIEPNTQFTYQQNNLTADKPRLELELFESQKNAVDLQKSLIKKQTLPKISAFGIGGLGNPGLNMLDNSLQDFYMAGVKLQWNVFDFQSNKKQRLATELNKELIDNQKQVFEWQQKTLAENYQAEIVKYQNLLQKDAEIIGFRKKIVETAAKQLKHDLITTSDYTAELNNLLEAEINQKNHEIQLALAQSNYKITLYE